MTLKLAFMGTPDFSVPILSALLDAGHAVAAVYSQPPRPAGRGHKERLSPVHAFAAARGIPVLTPRSLRGAEEQVAFRALDLDIAVVAAYGLILPKPVLEAPRRGCVNAHASLLPRWRGAAPIQRAILAGDERTGVTIMQMDEGLDTGAMLAMRDIPIQPDDTGAMLHDALAVLGADLMVSTLADIESGRARATPQPSEGATYAAKLAKDEGRLDWTLPAASLERAVRAFAPWPGAWFLHGGARIKVLAAAVADGLRGAEPGLLLDERLSVACEDGTALRLLRLQREGRAALDADAFLRGFAMPRGDRLCPATS